MKVSKLAGIGMISCILSSGVSSCKKASYKLVERNEVPKEIVYKLDSLSDKSKVMTDNKTYSLFGYDTVEITKKFSDNTSEYMASLNKKAQKKTPKIKTGMHLENLMIPKTGGGFDIIPVMKPTMEPKYTETKAIINSTDVFTKNGKDMYIPVEYYGK